VTHVLLLNLVFFDPETCGATAFVLIVHRVLRSALPPAAEPP